MRLVHTDLVSEGSVPLKAQLTVLRVVKMVRTEDRRWRVDGFKDHLGDYDGALATARDWNDAKLIELGQVRVTMSVHSPRMS